MPVFRSAAGNPDRPGPTGGRLDDVMRGATAIWPQLHVERYSGTEWEPFAARLRAGWSASLAVLSSALPTRLQFGFRGPHQVGAVLDAGQYRLMNPLAHSGAALAWIAESDLRTAARAVANGYILAALFEPLPGGITLPIYVLRERPGTLTVKAGTTVKGWRPKADGSGWEVAKTWAPKPTASTARFDAVLARLSGRTSPTSLLRVTAGYFAGLFVASAEVEETFDPAKEAHAMTRCAHHGVEDYAALAKAYSAHLILTGSFSVATNSGPASSATPCSGVPSRAATSARRAASRASRPSPPAISS